MLVPLQETGLEQEANDAAARVAGVGGDREDRYNLDCTAALPACLAAAEAQAMMLQQDVVSQQNSILRPSSKI